MTTYEVTLVIPDDLDVGADSDRVTIQVEDSEYVLASARRQGYWLPADCQQGWCTTCAARRLSGEVDQSDSRRYYTVDDEADLILPCTAKPRSDLVIEVGKHEEMLDHRAAHDLPPGSSKR